MAPSSGGLREAPGSGGGRDGPGAPDRVDVPCPACGEPGGEEVVRAVPYMPPGGGDPYPFVRCARCGLVRLSPRVADEAMGRFYGASYLPFRGADAWGRWAPVVAASFRRMARRRVAVVTEVASLGPGAAVLDVGCGRPLFLRELLSTGARAVGLDRTDDAWKDDPGAWAGVELVTGPPERAVEIGPFDAITLWHVLEHVSRPVGVLSALREAVRPGGALVVEVPDHSSWTRRAQGAFWAGYDAPRHTLAFEPPSLTALLERAGWKVERVRRRGTFDPWLLWWLGRQGRRGRRLEGSLEGRFAGMAAGKVLSWPLVAVTRGVGLGSLTAVARPG